MGKKQHYVPVFYLKGFVGADAPFLWVYEREKQPWKSRPDGVGFENYFYSFTDNTGQRNDEYLENAFNVKETAAAAVFEKIKEFQTILDADKPHFAAFVALMIARVPSFRLHIDKLAAKLAVDELKETWSNPQEFETLMAKFQEETGRTIPIPIEELRNQLLTEDMKVTQVNPDFSLQFIAHSKRVETYLLGMNWQFIRATATENFLTSDNPVYRHGRRIYEEQGEIIFPVSSEICFRGHWRNQARPVEYKQFTEQDIKKVNGMVTAIANRFVFSSKSSDSIKEFVDRYLGTVTLSMDGNIPDIKIPAFQ